MKKRCEKNGFFSDFRRLLRFLRNRRGPGACRRKSLAIFDGRRRSFFPIFPPTPKEFGKNPSFFFQKKDPRLPSKIASDFQRQTVKRKIFDFSFSGKKANFFLFRYFPRLLRSSGKTRPFSERKRTRKRKKYRNRRKQRFSPGIDRRSMPGENTRKTRESEGTRNRKNGRPLRFLWNLRGPGIGKSSPFFRYFLRLLALFSRREKRANFLLFFRNSKKYRSRGKYQKKDKFSPIPRESEEISEKRRMEGKILDLEKKVRSFFTKEKRSSIFFSGSPENSMNFRGTRRLPSKIASDFRRQRSVFSDSGSPQIPLESEGTAVLPIRVFFSRFFLVFSPGIDLRSMPGENRCFLRFLAPFSKGKRANFFLFLRKRKKYRNRRKTRFFHVFSPGIDLRSMPGENRCFLRFLAPF